MELPENLLERGIDRGSILHSVIFENIDHGKFFVIMGIDDDNVAGFFYINSRIHEVIRSKEEQYLMQMPIRQSDYKFLNYDSFVCASSLVRISRKRLAASMASGQTKFVGEMTPDDMDILLRTARDSKLFSAAEKRAYFYE